MFYAHSITIIKKRKKKPLNEKTECFNYPLNLHTGAQEKNINQWKDGKKTRKPKRQSKSEWVKLGPASMSIHTKLFFFVMVSLVFFFRAEHYRINNLY